MSVVELVYTRSVAEVAADLRAAVKAAEQIFLLREELALAQAEEDRVGAQPTQIWSIGIHGIKRRVV